MPSRETSPAFYRPAERRLSSLTNEELQALFELRASKIELDPKGFWGDNRVVYWGLTKSLLDLYEVMQEMQARYPLEEIGKYANGYFHELLPVAEREWLEMALDRIPEEKLPYGLKELPKTKTEGRS